MPKYENSIIYKLCHQNDLENNNIYIGSTTNFRSRKNKHKSDCNNEKAKGYNLFVYQFIRDNGGWDEWKMIPIEVYPCNSNNELEVRERYHIELLKSKLNKVIPTRNIKEYCKEYYEANKENILKQKKQYRNDNKEIITEKKKEYYESNKEILAEHKKQYYEANKENILKQKKQYHNTNKKKIAENKKKRYEANKEIINEKRKQKTVCDHCGSEIRKDDLARHKKTNKCKNYNITKE